MKDNESRRVLVEEIIRLTREIEEGRYTQARVKEKLAQIKHSYDDPFKYYEFSRTSPPWDKNYLKSLMQAGYFRVVSSEYLLYMAEVADAVYRPQRIRRRLLWIACILVVMSVVVMSVLILFGCLDMKGVAP